MEQLEVTAFRFTDKPKGDGADYRYYSPKESFTAYTDNCISIEPLVKLSDALALLDAKDAEIAALRDALQAIDRMFDWEQLELGLMSEVIHQALNPASVKAVKSCCD